MNKSKKKNAVPSSCMQDGSCNFLKTRLSLVLKRPNQAQKLHTSSPCSAYRSNVKFLVFTGIYLGSNPLCSWPGQTWQGSNFNCTEIRRDWEMIQYFFCKSWAPEAVSAATIYWHSSPVTIKLLQFTKAEERCPSTSCKHLPEAGHFFIRQTSRYCLLWLFHWIVPLNLHESSVKWGTQCKTKCDSPSEQVPAPEACCSPTTPLRSHSISVALPDPCTTPSWGCLRVYLASCIAF